MPHTANPFDLSGTLDTSNYDTTVQTESFGATGPVTDAGQPTAGARTAVVPNSAADVCAAVDQDANLTTVGNNRAAYLAEVNATIVRMSLAQ